MTARTQDEILARYEASDDFFGFAREVLLEAMTVDSIGKVTDAPKETVIEVVRQVEAAGPLEKRARDYLAFAVGKIVDHRGISAERSVTKLREFAWLLGRDDVVQAMDASDYPQYGAPKVKAFADGMGWPFTADSAWQQQALEAMALGRLCEDECMQGCGQ